MTIQVRITNESADRIVTVAHRDLDKETGRSQTGPTSEIKPGKHAIFYVHLLRDLIVSEVHP